jgi:hypothetical protein
VLVPVVAVVSLGYLLLLRRTSAPVPQATPDTEAVTIEEH